MRPVVLMTCSINDERTTYTGSLSYVRAVEAAGGTVIALPANGQSDAMLEQVCNMADALLLPGGYDIDPAFFGEEYALGNGRVDPEVDALDMYLARYALRTGKPVFGICRGCQVLNVAAGGGLYQDLPSQYGRAGLLQHSQRAPRWHSTHQVVIESDSLLASILGETKVRVNSFHHQAVKSTGSTTRIVARSADGVVEAIQVTEHPFALGVQWHPEAMVDRHPMQRQLFTAFVQAGLSAPKSKG